MFRKLFIMLLSIQRKVADFFLIAGQGIVDIVVDLFRLIWFLKTTHYEESPSSCNVSSLIKYINHVSVDVMEKIYDILGNIQAMGLRFHMIMLELPDVITYFYSSVRGVMSCLLQEISLALSEIQSGILFSQSFNPLLSYIDNSFFDDNILKLVNLLEEIEGQISSVVPLANKIPMNSRLLTMGRVPDKIKGNLDSNDYRLLRKLIFYRKMGPLFRHKLETYQDLIKKIKSLLMNLPIFFRTEFSKPTVNGKRRRRYSKKAPDFEKNQAKF